MDRQLGDDIKKLFNKGLNCIEIANQLDAKVSEVAGIYDNLCYSALFFNYIDDVDFDITKKSQHFDGEYPFYYAGMLKESKNCDKHAVAEERVIKRTMSRGKKIFRKRNEDGRRVETTSKQYSLNNNKNIDMIEYEKYMLEESLAFKNYTPIEAYTVKNWDYIKTKLTRKQLVYIENFESYQKENRRDYRKRIRKTIINLFNKGGGGCE